MHQDTTKIVSGHGMRWLRLAIQKGALWYYVPEVSHLGQLWPSHENLLLGVPWVSESIGIVNEAWVVMAVLMASISSVFDNKLIPPRPARGAPS